MTDPQRREADEGRESGGFVNESGPGSDPGAAYHEAVEEGEIEEADDRTGPGVGDVYRSGS